jgi:hypothetical protein
MIRVKASLFEIFKNTNQTSEESRKGLSGLVTIDDAAIEGIRELCSNAKIDKVIILYHDYAFSLLGVSFSDEASADTVQIGASNKYKFQAKDIQLEALAA